MLKLYWFTFSPCFSIIFFMEDKIWIDCLLLNLYFSFSMNAKFGFQLCFVAFPLQFFLVSKPCVIPIQFSHRQYPFLNNDIIISFFEFVSYDIFFHIPFNILLSYCTPCIPAALIMPIVTSCTPAADQFPLSLRLPYINQFIITDFSWLSNILLRNFIYLLFFIFVIFI